MIIAIDGPAGSGKSSTARAVARRLGFKHLDSGAFYRALTHEALRAGWPVEQWDNLQPEQLDELGVHARPSDGSFRLFAHDRDISAEIRSPEVNAHVSQMAQIPAVRAWLLEQLRDAARDSDLVADGRDMGTVVFPDAELKVFLTAGLPTRARRRLAEQGVTEPSATELSEEVARLARRDRIDSKRVVAPLRQAEDAVVLDTTEVTFDEQVAAVVDVAHSRGARLT